ncbi:MAG: gliding motility-associated C-terminal domain-containing protein [Saprospiraceae bacterium]|nr:gliding motility-associated C-terminal domain-containing protein [Saprospiraceae bacterium]MBP7699020.1 gliding motility-associated C-terminal domain-containing protein [Saprospiraceae bacterium]
MKKVLLLLSTVLFLLSSMNNASAQTPANDDCDTALMLPGISPYCSASGEFSNVGATPSTYGAPSCFGSVGNDVWFTFTALATDVSITVSGLNIGGTLNAPAVALYVGTCGGSINELQCDVDNNGTHIVEIYKGGLIVGATYLIRVQGLNNGTGTFQLCVNNYNPPVDPQGDCPLGSILCDKSPFVVQAVTGAGSDNSELDDASCLSGAFGAESNSTWFRWIADNNGALTFNITPLNPNDDIDFVLYELPNGINSCVGKVEKLCMASGPHPSTNCSSYPISNCAGVTGLRNSSSDISEPPNCCPGQDNFLAPLQMVAGRAYALAINNFTSTGNGFSIDFGGDGEFRGPTADFTISNDTICIDELITLTDNSTFALGAITGWEWAFGVGSTPATATTQGSHNVSYLSTGNKSIVLTVLTDLGCKVTKVKNLFVRGVLDVDTLSITPTCFGESDGSIQVNVKPYCSTPPFMYNWGSGNTPNNFINNIAAGTYTVTITDVDNRMRVHTFNIGQPALLVADMDTTNISCFGQMDGQASVFPMGGTPEYNYLWNDGTVTFTNLGLTEGNYTVTVTDLNGCTTIGGVYVSEPIELSGEILGVTNVICFGDTTGTIALQGIAGSPPYEYSIDGITFQSDTVLQSLAAGTHDVYIRDNRGCLDTLMATIVEPAQLIAQVGQDTTIQLGYTVRLEATYTPPAISVTYQWSHPETLTCDTCAITIAQPYNTTNYVVTVTDLNGCTATDVLRVRIDKERPIYIPTAFSPNIDGFNDFFTMYAGPAVAEIKEFKVFDRWGELIFETNNIKPNVDRAGWDGTFKGKAMNPAVFVYFFRVQFIDNEEVIYKGGITLMRF